MLNKTPGSMNHPPFYYYVAASTVAAIIENLFCYPIDTIKSRLQCATTSNRLLTPSALPELKRVVLPNAHTLRDMRDSLLTGFWPNTSYRVLQRNIMFGLQPLVNHLFHDKAGPIIGPYIGNTYREPLFGVLAGVVSSLVEILVLPLSTISVRMQTQDHSLKKAVALGNLYNGSKITFIRNTLVAAPVLYGTSSYIKQRLKLENSEDATIEQDIIASSIGAILSTLASHPIDTVKTKIQASQFTLGELAVAKGILAQSGLKGFLRGIIPRVCNATPRTVFAMTATNQLVKRAMHYKEHGFFATKKADIQTTPRLTAEEDMQKKSSIKDRPSL